MAIRRQLSDAAAAYVRGLIMSGASKPGDTVRPESIGEQLDISSTPAREALQMLRAEGFLQLAPGRGFTVAPLTGDDIRDIFTTQALLAGELAARFATTATDADLNELEALHHELIAAARRQQTEDLEAKNHAFHRQINRVAGSPKLLWALGLVTRYVPRQFYSAIPGWPQATVSDHTAILAALQARDPQAARAAMHAHITHAGSLLAENFDHRTR